MAELRQDFSKARMNKDMDERLVPNGEYRDANNIQIATSDGSDIGTVQSLLSNYLRNRTEQNASEGNYNHIYTDGSQSTDFKHTVVGTVADASKDKIYYLVSGGDLYNANGYPSVRKDYIIEYDTVTETNKYVFVDIFEVDTTVSGAPGSTTTFHIALGAGDSQYDIGIRVGMNITTTATTPNTTLNTDLVVTAIAYDTDGGTNKWKITTNKAHGLSDTNAIAFEAKRVLNFSKFNLITGINILEDFIYFTDNVHEPKKISISRSIAGTGGLVELNTEPTDIFTGNTQHFHTRLVKDSSSYEESQNTLRVVVNDAGTLPVYVDESHVTVIRKSPTQPLKLKMFRQESSKINSQGEENPVTGTIENFMHDFNGNVLGPSGQLFSDADGFFFTSEIDIREGDIILGTLEENLDLETAEEDYFDYRMLCLDSPVTGPNNLTAGASPNNTFVFSLLSMSSAAQQYFDDQFLPLQNLHVKIQEKDIIFQHKFPRFSYRYKYQDGEYSTFAPFSEVAFLTGDYEYKPNKGYNFGMSNQLRTLHLTDFVGHEDIMPEDVVEIDILYKETNNPTVYSVETLKPTDDGWPGSQQLQDQNNDNRRGFIELDTDLIHAVIPSNQLLRPYDNVPRKALAQEITANRLIYGNYVQNYTIDSNPRLSVNYQRTKYSDGGFEYAPPSVKSLRNYQVGVVFSDEYGRETPVLSSDASSVFIPIQASADRNRLAVALDVKNTTIPDWAKYFSYYVKEPTAEYYTMAMDRWYNAEDGNIWISFPSADRNKIQEDDTIILKKAAGSNEAIKVDNRYKVLAISNEAPDFIKETKKVLGTVVASLGTIGNTSTGSMYPLPGVNRISVTSADFIKQFGHNLHVITPDKLLLRIEGAGETSDLYEVAALTRLIEGTGPIGGGNFAITTKKPFGEDMSFTSTTNSGLDAIDEIRLTLIQVDVLNKPEFDGRFFVKIFKDPTLAKYVLIQQQEDLVVGRSFPLRYINNNAYDNLGANGTIMPPSINPFGEYNTDFNGNEITGSTPLENDTVTASGDRENHPTEYSYNTGGTMTNNSGEPTNNTGTYTWGFFSNNNPFSAGVTASHISNNPIGALNNNHQDGDSEKYWEEVANQDSFFIDGCTAYDWNGNIQVNHTSNQGNIIFDEQFDATIRASEYNDGYEGSYTGNCTFDANPSRAIWGSGRLMDISWCQFTRNHTHNSGSTPYAQKLQDSASGDDQAEALAFIQELVTPGTKFRFSRDPDAIIYTTIGTYGYGSSNIEGTLKYNDPLTWVTSQTTNETGAWGIRNYASTGVPMSTREKRMFNYGNIRQRWTIRVSNSAGGGIGSAGHGYDPTRGTLPLSQGGPLTNAPEFRRALHHDGTDADAIQIMIPLLDNVNSEETFVDNPAVWEIEPRETVELDIYYQASPLIPIVLDKSTNEELLPIGSTFTLPAQEAAQGVLETPETTHTITGWSDQTMTFTPAVTTGFVFEENQLITFNKYSNYSLNARLDVTASASAGVTQLTLHGGPTTNENVLKIPYQTHFLDYNNCWCFGNGVESDRVRDMFNDPQMDNGVKASTVVADPSLLTEERKKHGLIWSGIYSSNTSTNDTNQFIAAEPITKDINPVYGSIQRLLNRETRLVMFCEDKVLRAVTNKDALYNADGNPQLVSSNAVIGDVTPYAGKYGIATNPESMAATPENTYFTDVMRGRVLVLSNSGDGIRPISDIGMKDYFADFMADYVDTAIGSYDSRKKEYNITISKKYEPYQAQSHEQTTVSYSEYSKGWISFKSYYPDAGISLNNKYYTFKNGLIYEHHYEQDAGTIYSRNQFYGTQYTSDITPIFNGMPESVKGFNYFKYEGSNAKIPLFQELHNQNYFTGDYSVNDGLIDTDNVTDGEYYNIYFKVENQLGWYIDNVTTNLQTCGNVYFLNKEGKHYAYPTGETTSLSNLDTKEFSVQGIGMANIVHNDNTVGDQATLTFTNNLNPVQNFGGAGQSDFTGNADQLGLGRWTITDATYNATVGTALGSSQTVEMTISPFYDDVYTGFPVSASNFKLDGATESPAGTFTVDNNTGVKSSSGSAGAGDGLELDSAVASVVFSDNGVAGDPANTVKVTVNLNASFIPTGSGTTTLDIDEVVAKTARERSSCLLVQYDNLSNASETANAVSGITTANVLNLSHVINQHSGNVNEGESNLIAHYTFATTGTSYYVGGVASPTVSFESLGAYAPYYSYTIDLALTGSNITSFVVKIYYDPPVVSYLSVDPPDICALAHKAVVRAQVKTPDVDLHDIRSLSYTPDVSSIGGIKTITVRGAKNAKYKLSVQKKQGLNNPVTTTTGGYYDFSKNSFVDDESGVIGTIDATGFVDHLVSFPSVSADTRYDIIVDGIVNGSTFSLADSIPTIAGDATITQHGTRTLTLSPTTQTAANFGTLPTVDIIRPARHNRDRYYDLPFLKINQTGTTKNVASTRLLLDKENKNIKQGMFVIDPSSNTSIPHNTTVVGVRSNAITLSNACTIPDNTRLTFIKGNASFVPFTLTIPPGIGKTLYLNSSASVVDSLATESVSFVPHMPTSDDITIRPSTSLYTPAQQFEFVSRVNVGDIVSGNKVSTNNLTVAATDTSAFTITLNQSDIGAEQSDKLSFSGSAAAAKVVHATSAITDGDLIINGYLKIDDVNTRANIPVFIDNLVNVN